MADTENKQEKSSPPSGYVCSLCKKPGHWIEQCSLKKNGKKRKINPTHIHEPGVDQDDGVGRDKNDDESPPPVPEEKDDGIGDSAVAERLQKLGPVRYPSSKVRSSYMLQFTLLKEDDERRLKPDREDDDAIWYTHVCKHCHIPLTLKWKPKLSGKEGGSYHSIVAQRHLEKCNGGGRDAIAPAIAVKLEKAAMKHAHTIVSRKSSTPATADLCDHHIESPTRLQILHPNLFTSFGLKHSFHGKIRTVQCFESNPLVRETLSSPGTGDVLVVDGGGSSRCAIMGDALATFAVGNGWSGVVVNGYIRDSWIINGMDVGVKALGTHPLKSLKDNRGKSNVRVNFGGVEFVPGHYLYSDADGIIVSEEELSLPP